VKYVTELLLGIFFDAERGGDMFLQNVSGLFTGLHDIFQKIELLIFPFIIYQQ
jgi:hypothetical protein